MINLNKSIGQGRGRTRDCSVFDPEQLANTGLSSMLDPAHLTTLGLSIEKDPDI